MRLTDLAIKKLPLLEQGQKIHFDDALPGFGIRVSRKSKSFVVKYGKTRRLKTIGRYPHKSLADARKEAKRFLAVHSPHIVSALYVDAVQAFIEECENKNRPNTVREYKRFLTAFESTKKVSDISRRALQNHLARYRHTPSNYAHALTAFKVFFNWAIRNDLAESHPLAGEPAPPLPARARVLSTDELKEIYDYEHPPFSDIVKLCILTGQRRSEIAAIHTSWINDDTITFPGSITKNKRTHTMPFGHLTAELLGGDGALFATDKGTPFSAWSKAKERLDKAVDLPHWTLHDLRRTFSTMHAELGTPLHIVERLLNHSSGTISGVVAVYNRFSYLDEMRHAVKAHEGHIRDLCGA